MVWGDVPGGNEKPCAHATAEDELHGVPLSLESELFRLPPPAGANKKMPQLHNEGDVTRNYVSYNFQTLRDDVFTLAHDGDVTGNRIGPARSSCAVHVGSYNANRESIYVQQQTISGEGLTGIAFSTNVPHTVRGGPPLVRDRNDPDRTIPGPRHVPRATATPRCAPTATSQRTTTTTQSWLSS